MKRFLKRILGMCMMLVVFSIGWTVAYFVTSYVYESLQWEIHPWLEQIITSVIGMLFIFLAFGFAMLFNRKAHQRRNHLFKSITDAMKQMSSGDFDVYLEKLEGHHHPDDPFSEIVDHVNQMAKDLGELEEMRQEFISNVSHEIQSPLTSISGFAKAAQSKKITDVERKRYLTIIETESKRLSKISDHLLKLTYLESSQHPVNKRDYRLDKQLQAIILASEPIWQEKELEMKLDLDAVNIHADEELFDQVWVNLLNNAIKFTEKKGSIVVKAYERDGVVKVMIVDTGIGISEEEKIHLFERFYKADKARSRDASGSGLGLAIVKKVLAIHEASIVVESDERGSTFTITFPNEMQDGRS